MFAGFQGLPEGSEIAPKSAREASLTSLETKDLCGGPKLRYIRPKLRYLGRFGALCGGTQAATHRTSREPSQVRSKYRLTVHTWISTPQPSVRRRTNPTVELERSRRGPGQQEFPVASACSAVACRTNNRPGSKHRFADVFRRVKNWRRSFPEGWESVGWGSEMASWRSPGAVGRQVGPS